MKTYDTTILTRKIIIDIWKKSGKWYASGFAFIKPNEPYFNNQQELLKDIDSSNDQLVIGAISGGEFIISIREIEDEIGQPFVTRLIL